MAPGGGAGRMAPPVSAPPSGEGEGGPTGPVAGGFVVRVEGRLLYGRTQPEAVAWLTQAFYENLRQKAREPGLGFYLPPEDAKDPQKRSIGNPSPLL